MHEGGIVQAIVDAAVAALQQHGAAGRATTVRVTVGVCQGLVPEAMQMFFDAFKPDTPLADAQLVVELQGMVARCAACAKEFELVEPIMFCQECGRPMELIKGKEILLNAIEVENDDDRR